MRNLLFILLILGPVLLVQGNPSCASYDDDEIVVHLICHTHDDVGWLKTVDQYFYGANNSIQRAGVQYILNSVVGELQKDSARKFSYVETAFFHRWWSEQSAETQQIVTSLINTGQLELVNGGWCMNDEAAAYYTDIIDQMTYGLRFLNDTFGPEVQPRVAWQIDPFGHSNGQASLFAQMGFDGLFFGRLDHADKGRRWGDRDLEMVWQPSHSLGNASWLFTGVLPNGYNPPEGFCFDDVCTDQPIMDDPRLSDYNVIQKVKDFLAAVEDQVKAYRTNHVIMTMGSDFQYQNARKWYKNLDKLIKHVGLQNSLVNGKAIRVVYSTPSCYLDAKHSAAIEWPTKQDDFFPYSSDPHAYWTGYFTSRPALKGFIRDASSFLQAMKQQYVLESLPYDVLLEGLDRALGVAQHHDAVTGTAKQHVTDDYVLRLTDGVEALANVSYQRHGESFCSNLNISACDGLEDKTFTSFNVKVWNSIGRARKIPVRFPVDISTNYTVTDSAGDLVESQTIPIPESVLELPKAHRDSKFTQELTFFAQVPAIGAANFKVTRSNVSPSNHFSELTEHKSGQDSNIQVGSTRIRIDGSTGLLNMISQKDGKSTEVEQELMWYAGMAGDNSEFSKRASGAYIFRPNGTVANSFGEPTHKIYSGPVVTEVHTTFSSWASQVVRVFTDDQSESQEFHWMVGPIPIEDGVGKEVINRFTHKDLQSEGIFYTDANGREIQKRVRNHRDTWTLNVTEPISGNYYPVNSRISVKDTKTGEAFAVLTDRSQGGSSLVDGQVELMVHRRLLHDDAFGVGEALNETEFGEGLIVRGKHNLIFHNGSGYSSCDFVCKQRSLAEAILSRRVVSFSGFDSKEPLANTTHGLTLDLPANVHLLTLSPLPGHAGQLLVRLEHMYEAGESQVYSLPVTVSLQHLLKGKEITQARETTLSANKWKDEAQRLQWKTEDQSSRPVNPKFRNGAKNSFGEHFEQTEAITGNFSVTLKPMQIRTFIVSVKNI